MLGSVYTLHNLISGQIQGIKNLENDNLLDIKTPMTSAGEGLDEWWNGNFRYRRCINLTNPYSENLTDWRTYIEIDTTDLIPDKMQADLGDVRIVENGVLREYVPRKWLLSQNIVQ